MFQGAIGRSARVRRGSGTTRSRSMPITRPKPWQVGQAPSGELNENSGRHRPAQHLAADRAGELARVAAHAHAAPCRRPPRPFAASAGYASARPPPAGRRSPECRARAPRPRRWRGSGRGPAAAGLPRRPLLAVSRRMTSGSRRPPPRRSPSRRWKPWRISSASALSAPRFGRGTRDHQEGIAGRPARASSAAASSGVKLRAGPWPRGQTDLAQVGVEQAQDVVGLGDGADCRAGVPDRVLGLQGHRRQDVVDGVDRRPLHLVEELPRVGRHRLDEAALALGEDGVEGERRLAGAGGPGHHGHRAVRHPAVDPLEVVGAGVLDPDGWLARHRTPPPLLTPGRTGRGRSLPS